jgi:hypothetical protein
MSSLKKIFRVVDDIPTIEPVGINIPCFKELYLADRTLNKSEYAKQLAFIYHMTAYDSPYFNVKDKTATIAYKFLGIEDFIISPILQACIDECLLMESCAEARALDAVSKLIDNISAQASALEADNKEYLILIKEFDAALKDESDLTYKAELMIKKQAIQAAQSKQTESASKIIESLSKNTKTIIDMRKTVSQAAVDFEGNNTQKVSDYFDSGILNEF